ncbi:MAG: PIN domain-containing protein [Rhodospirillales bacterium]
MAGPNVTFYWDTCVFIAWLKNENRPSGEMDGVRDIVDRVKKRNASIITSAITFAEVTEAKVGAGVINLFDDLFKRPNLGRINVDMRVAKLARDLRDYYSARPSEFNDKTLSVPDSIHLATAILYHAAEFHTFDKSNRNGTLGLLPLSGNVGGHNLKVCKPETEQPSFDLL